MEKLARDAYMTRIAAGIHLMRKQAEYQGMTKLADGTDWDQFMTTAGDWLKNNWGKVGGSLLLALLGSGIGHKIGGPFGSVLGGLLGGFGGWHGGNFVQNNWTNWQNGGQGAQGTASSKPAAAGSNAVDPAKWSAWTDAYQRAYNEKRRAPTAMENVKIGWGKHWSNAKNRSEFENQNIADANKYAIEQATKTTGWEPPQSRLPQPMTYKYVKEQYNAK